MAPKGKKRRPAGGGTPVPSPISSPAKSSIRPSVPPPLRPSTPTSTSTTPATSPPPSPPPAVGAFPTPPPSSTSAAPVAARPPPPSSPSWSAPATRTKPPKGQRKSIIVVNKLASFARKAFWLFLAQFWYPILMVLIALMVSVPALGMIYAGYKRVTGLIPSLSLSPLGSLLLIPFTSSASLPALLYSSYCHSIGLGLGCSTNYPAGSDVAAPGMKVGLVARKLREEASRASDIFQSVVELSDMNQMGLHQVEIWELAMAVKRGSKLQDKEILAESLVDLGDLTRDMKDKLIGINSEGINSFSWIVHEFARLESHLLTISPPPPSSESSAPLLSNPSSSSVNTYTQTHHPSPRSMRLFQNQLTSLLTHLSTSLTSLQSSIEATLPLADRASKLGGQLQEEFFASELVLEEESRRDPVWLPLVGRAKELAMGRGRDVEEGYGGVGVGGGGGGWGGEGGGWRRSEGVKRDLKLTRETVGKLKDLRRGMEDLRSELIGYRDNVGWFRAGVVGWYLGGSDADDEEEMMDPEIEMEGLRSIISKFSGAVQDAKFKGRVGSNGGARGGGDAWPAAALPVG
ncbi:hypothetical protein BDY24DRAFT_404321 [Mrakia frigida]|uniref:uncharacterized protein n=1 Tax=Mrakia frigida TaxID=29902 RepID=UPI003FCC047A